MKLLFWLLFALSIYGQDGNYIWKDSSKNIYYGNENNIIFKSEGIAGIRNNIIFDFIMKEKYYEYKTLNTITQDYKNGRYYFYDSTNTSNREYPGRWMGLKYIPEEEVFLILIRNENFCLYKYNISNNRLSDLIAWNLETVVGDLILEIMI